jgi:hypothetical protein
VNNKKKQGNEDEVVVKRNPRNAASYGLYTDQNVSMVRSSTVSVLFLWLAETMATLVLRSSLVGYAAACGAFFCEPQRPVVQSGEAIIFGVSDNKASMHVLINYEGPAEGFSWLLPIMFEPALNTSSCSFFRSMFDQTLPQFTFSVDFEDSDMCDDEGSLQCERSPVAAPTSATDGDVEVKEGNVGPFEYTIIKAVNKDVFTIQDWLATNGYDKNVGSAEILNYYVKHEYYFLALRLRKDTDSSDLVPIAIEFEMPEGMDTIACIPLIMTGVAATQTMSIQVYIYWVITGQSLSTAFGLSLMRREWTGLVVSSIVTASTETTVTELQQPIKQWMIMPLSWNTLEIAT